MDTKEIDFTKGYFEVLNSLNNISSKFLIKRNDAGELYIFGHDESKVIAFRIVAPEYHFDFKGDYCGFHQFNHFYNKLEALSSFGEEVKIEQTEMDIIIKSGNAKATERLAVEEAVMPELRDSDTSGLDGEIVEFEIGADYLRKIRSLVSPNNINANRFKFEVKGSEVTLELYNTRHRNKFTDIIEGESNGNSTYVSITDSKNILSLPIASYKIRIFKKFGGIAEWVMQREDDIVVNFFYGSMAEK